MSVHAAPSRRAIAFGIGAGLALGLARAARAQDAVQLFKVITAKDEITIGVTPAELATMGNGEPVKILAQALISAGQITVWQYAVGRDASGGLQMNPLRRVAILKADSLRIEPASTTYKIAPPKP